MTSEIREFSCADFGSVRLIDREGNPWFIAKRVCEVLGYKNTRDAVSKHIDDEDRDEVAIRDSIGREQMTTIINESGFYSLVLGSKLPSAKKFKRWVTSEVLPSIRRTGGYGGGEMTAALGVMVEMMRGQTELLKVVIEGQKAMLETVKTTNMMVCKLVDAMMTKQQKKRMKEDERMREHERIMMAIRAFSENFEICSDDYLRLDDLWREFCEESSIEISQNLFSKHLKTLFVDMIKKQKRTGDSMLPVQVVFLKRRGESRKNKSEKKDAKIALKTAVQISKAIKDCAAPKNKKANAIAVLQRCVDDYKSFKPSLEAAGISTHQIEHPYERNFSLRYLYMFSVRWLDNYWQNKVFTLLNEGDDGTLNASCYSPHVLAAVGNGVADGR